MVQDDNADDGQGWTLESMIDWGVESREQKGETLTKPDIHRYNGPSVREIKDAGLTNWSDLKWRVEEAYVRQHGATKITVRPEFQEEPVDSPQPYEDSGIRRAPELAEQPEDSDELMDGLFPGSQDAQPQWGEDTDSLNSAIAAAIAPEETPDTSRKGKTEPMSFIADTVPAEQRAEIAERTVEQGGVVVSEEHPDAHAPYTPASGTAQRGHKPTITGMPFEMPQEAPKDMEEPHRDTMQDVPVDPAALEAQESRPQYDSTQPEPAEPLSTVQGLPQLDPATGNPILEPEADVETVDAEGIPLDQLEERLQADEEKKSTLMGLGQTEPITDDGKPGDPKYMDSQSQMSATQQFIKAMDKATEARREAEFEGAPTGIHKLSEIEEAAKAAAEATGTPDPSDEDAKPTGEYNFIQAALDKRSQDERARDVASEFIAEESEPKSEYVPPTPLGPEQTTDPDAYQEPIGPEQVDHNAYAEPAGPIQPMMTEQDPTQGVIDSQDKPDEKKSSSLDAAVLAAVAANAAVSDEALKEAAEKDKRDSQDTTLPPLKESVKPKTQAYKEEDATPTPAGEIYDPANDTPAEATAELKPEENKGVLYKLAEWRENRAKQAAERTKKKLEDRLAAQERKARGYEELKEGSTGWSTAKKVGVAGLGIVLVAGAIGLYSHLTSNKGRSIATAAHGNRAVAAASYDAGSQKTMDARVANALAGMSRGSPDAGVFSTDDSRLTMASAAAQPDIGPAPIPGLVPPTPPVSDTSQPDVSQAGNNADQSPATGTGTAPAVGPDSYCNLGLQMGVGSTSFTDASAQADLESYVSSQLSAGNTTFYVHGFSSIEWGSDGDTVDDNNPKNTRLAQRRANSVRNQILNIANSLGYGGRITVNADNWSEVTIWSGRALNRGVEISTGDYANPDSDASVASTLAGYNHGVQNGSCGTITGSIDVPDVELPAATPDADPNIQDDNAGPTQASAGSISSDDSPSQQDAPEAIDIDVSDFAGHPTRSGSDDFDIDLEMEADSYDSSQKKTIADLYGQAKFGGKFNLSSIGHMAAIRNIPGLTPEVAADIYTATRITEEERRAEFDANLDTSEFYSRAEIDNIASFYKMSFGMFLCDEEYERLGERATGLKGMTKEHTEFVFDQQNLARKEGLECRVTRGYNPQESDTEIDEDKQSSEEDQRVASKQPPAIPIAINDIDLIEVQGEDGEWYTVIHDEDIIGPVEDEPQEPLIRIYANDSEQEAHEPMQEGELDSWLALEVGMACAQDASAYSRSPSQPEKRSPAYTEEQCQLVYELDQEGFEFDDIRRMSALRGLDLTRDNYHEARTLGMLAATADERNADSDAEEYTGYIAPADDPSKPFDLKQEILNARFDALIWDLEDRERETGSMLAQAEPAQPEEDSTPAEEYKLAV